MEDCTAVEMRVAVLETDMGHMKTAVGDLRESVREERKQNSSEHAAILDKLDSMSYKVHPVYTAIIAFLTAAAGIAATLAVLSKGVG